MLQTMSKMVSVRGETARAAVATGQPMVECVAILHSIVDECFALEPNADCTVTLPLDKWVFISEHSKPGETIYLRVADEAVNTAKGTVVPPASTVAPAQPGAFNQVWKGVE